MANICCNTNIACSKRRREIKYRGLAGNRLAPHAIIKFGVPAIPTSTRHELGRNSLPSIRIIDGANDQEIPSANINPIIQIRSINVKNVPCFLLGKHSIK